MDKDEARQVARERLEELRRQPYDELLELHEHEERTGASGVEYQLEVRSFPDDKSSGNLRVTVAIDDGGWRAFAPLSDSFIVAPDGSFVGED